MNYVADEEAKKITFELCKKLFFLLPFVGKVFLLSHANEAFLK